MTHALLRRFGLGSTLGFFAIAIGLWMSFTGMVKLGILLFSATVQVHWLVLEVDSEASRDAKSLVLADRYKRKAVEEVLNVAPWVHSAADVSSFLKHSYVPMHHGLNWLKSPLWRGSR